MISPSRSTVKLTKKEIKTLFQSAKRVLRQPGLDILLGPTTHPIGHIVVVTPRLVGNAPARNKVRRRLKAIFYEERLFDQPYDCIVIIKKGGAELSFGELKGAIFMAYANAQKVGTHVQ